jgi:TatD DNase family protein
MLHNHKGRALVERMPMDRVLTETDGPFAVIGDRAIQPWDVRDAEIQLADIWRISVPDVELRLTTNLRQLLAQPTQ